MSSYQYQPLVGPFTTTPPSETQLYAPIYPDRVPRVTLPRAAHLVSAQNWPPIPTLIFPSGGGSISTNADVLWQYQGIAAPFVDTPPTVTGIEWQATYPSLATRQLKMTVGALPAWTMDRFDAPTPPTVPTFSGGAVFPDRVPGKAPTHRGAQTFAIDTQWLTPPIAVDLVAPRPVYPSRVWAKAPRYQHTWAHPPFAIEVDVPVMSWTGSAPDWIGRLRHPIQTPTIAPLYVADVTTTTPTLSWNGEQPHRVWPRRWSVPAVTARDVEPFVVPDVTDTAPTLSARATYPDRIAAKTSVRAPQAFTIDAQWSAPAVVAAPALATPVYPDRVDAKAPPAIHPDWRAPEFLTDVTLPAPTMSWTPQYPDRHREPLRPAVFNPFTADTIVAPRTNFKFWWVQVNRYAGPWDREPE